jgi:hypothetical protein
VSQGRSLFIPILAWLGIGLGLLGSLGAFMVIFAHKQGWAPLPFLLAAPLGVVTGVALLKRHNWARWVTILVLAAGIANFAVRFVMHGGRGLGLVIVLMGVLLNTLLIVRLCSRTIQAEFHA